jgi:spore coat-associated protein N
MKKIIGLGIVALLVIGLVGGGTWAYFSDYETSTGNSLVAGTLDLGLNGAGGSTTGTWSLAAGKPGDNVTGTLAIHNGGTIAMAHVTATFSYTFTDGTPATVHVTADPTTDNITKQIKTSTDAGTLAALQNKTIQELVDASPVALGSLAAGGDLSVPVKFNFLTTATNGCQGDTVAVSVTINGTQD